MSDSTHTKEAPNVQEWLVNRQVKVAALLPVVVPDEVDKDFREAPTTINTCILSSRVGFDVCRHYGIRVRAIPTSVQVFNGACVERVKSEGHWPRDQEEMQKWGSEDGSWAVGIGRTGIVRPGGYDAHLVLLTFYTEPDERTDGLLIDLALHQSSRPRHHINLQPHSTLTPAGFLRGEEALVLDQAGSWVKYGYYPEAVAYREAPDWLDKPRREFVVKRSIAKIDLALAAEGL